MPRSSESPRAGVEGYSGYSVSFIDPGWDSGSRLAQKGIDYHAQRLPARSAIANGGHHESWAWSFNEDGIGGSNQLRLRDYPLATSLLSDAIFPMRILFRRAGG